MSTKITVEAIEKKAKELDYDLEKINRAIKTAQNTKCVWNKKKGHPDFQRKMTEALKQIQLLHNVRDYVRVPKPTSTTMTQDDIDKLTYDETVRAIESLQSKKCRTEWLTTVKGDNDEYRATVAQLERMQAHKLTVKPVADNMVRKSDVRAIIDLIESNPGISEAKILEALRALTQ